MTSKKRVTREQRAAQQKQQLRLRISDIATGAAGYDFDAEGGVSAPFLERFVCALKCRFDADNKIPHLWEPQCLAYWEDIDTATQALWERGIRAGRG